MSDDIKTRLKTTSEECQKCYDVWSSNDKDNKAREALQDAIHELRKVASRLEIELAISERDQMKQRPLPIPPHRDAKGRNRNVEGGSEDDSGHPQGQSAGINVQRKPQRRRSPRPEGGNTSDAADNAGNSNS